MCFFFRSFFQNVLILAQINDDPIVDSYVRRGFGGFPWVGSCRLLVCYADVSAGQKQADLRRDVLPDTLEVRDDRRQASLASSSLASSPRNDVRCHL